MKRSTLEYKLYLEDILDSITKIEHYLGNITSYKDFLENEMVLDAIIKNLLIIGEAVKHIPEDIKKLNKIIEWKKIAGLRDVLIHNYFNIDNEIIWDIVTNKLSELKEFINKILKNLE